MSEPNKFGIIPGSVVKQVSVTVGSDGKLQGLPENMKAPSTSRSLFSFFRGGGEKNVGGGGGASEGSGSQGKPQKFEVSGPMNVRHNVHVTIDEKGGLRGLPKEWEALLSVSGISQTDVRQNPQAVIDVLKFHMVGHPSSLPPKAAALEKSLDSARAAVFDKATDPTTIFDIEEGHKLGEGASGVVRLGIDKRSGKKVAIKIAPVTDMANLSNEIALQAMSAHPSIVSLVGVFLHKENVWVRRVRSYMLPTPHPPHSLHQVYIHSRLAYT